MSNHDENKSSREKKRHMRKKILVTGGCGYIGSHTVVALMEAEFDVVVIDNLSNSSRNVLGRLEAITGREIPFVQADVRDRAALQRVFDTGLVDGVIHFAGLKSVGESTRMPIDYYQNNVSGLLTVLETMRASGVHMLIFSSSATVYGTPRAVPIREDAELRVTNPYGRSKLICEEILHDVIESPSQAAGGQAGPWRFGVLRYFNPVGAHVSGLIGESPSGVPNNLMPYVAQVACGILPKLTVHGGDYPTVDGTGVRDYIHVMDLAQGHVAALQALFAGAESFTANLGTGLGYSVLEVVRAYEHASGRAVPFEIGARRPGDVASCYADTQLAHRLLNWAASRTLDDMCVDSWRWQSMNPLGFAAASN